MGELRIKKTGGGKRGATNRTKTEPVNGGKQPKGVKQRAGGHGNASPKKKEMKKKQRNPFQIRGRHSDQNDFTEGEKNAAKIRVGQLIWRAGRKREALF